MEHGSDLTGIALVASIAVIGGLVLTRLRQPAIVGYILAGIALGGDGLGLIHKTANINTLAELGVIMLLFLIGMELSLRAFVSVLRTAVLCTLLQVAACVAFASGVTWLRGKGVETGIVFGFIISLSSTAVAVKMLADLGELRSEIGRITVGVLIAQDLAVVPMLITIGALSARGGGFDTVVLVKLGVAVVVIVAFIWTLSRRQRLTLPTHRWLKGKSDLVPLAAIAFCFSAAAATGAAGLSTAFGAFLAGLLIGNSTDRAATIRATLPIQSILMVVFFLSVGLLLDLDFLAQSFFTVMGWLALIVGVKTTINIAVLHLLGEPWERAFPAGVIMGQVGEFSFVLCTLAASAGLLSRDDKRLAIAVIALSLLISPLWQLTARRFHDAAAEGITGLRATLKLAYEQELGFAGRTAFVLRNGALALARTVRRPSRLRRRLP